MRLTYIIHWFHHTFLSFLLSLLPSSRKCGLTVGNLGVALQVCAFRAGGQMGTRQSPSCPPMVCRVCGFRALQLASICLC